MRIVKTTLLILLIIFGAFWVLAFFIVKNDNGGSTSGDITMLIILGIIPVLTGVFFLFMMRKSNAQEDKHNMTNQIIKIAQSHGGKVTTLDLLNELNLSVDDAKQELESLYSQGILRVEVSEKGGVYYELNESL